MSNRLRLDLLYKDGTNHELVINCPEEVAREIEHKGLVAAQIYVESFIQVPGGLEVDKFKKGS